MSVAELLIGVRVLLGEAPQSSCGCAFGCGGNPPSIAHLISAVGYALDGCGCPNFFVPGAGRNGVCVFRGDLTSLDCPRATAAVSFRAELGNARNPRIIFRIENPAASFLWTGFENGLRHWSTGSFVDERSSPMRGDASMAEGGKRLTLQRTSGNVLINGCRFDHFDGIYVGLRR